MRAATRKWIDIFTNFKSDGDDYFEGERIYEDAEKADRWVKAGWANEPGGDVSQPDLSPRALDVPDSVLGAASDAA